MFVVPSMRPSTPHVACDWSVYQSRTVFTQLYEIIIKKNCINLINQYKYIGSNAEQVFSNTYSVLPFTVTWSIDDNIIIILVKM